MKKLILLFCVCAATAGTDGVRYYKVETNRPDYDAIVDAATQIHKKTWPNNLLAVATNKNGTLAIIKVDWGKTTITNLNKGGFVKTNWSWANRNAMTEELGKFENE